MVKRRLGACPLGLVVEPAGVLRCVLAYLRLERFASVLFSCAALEQRQKAGAACWLVCVRTCGSMRLEVVRRERVPRAQIQ